MMRKVMRQASRCMMNNDMIVLLVFCVINKKTKTATEITKFKT